MSYPQSVNCHKNRSLVRDNDTRQNLGPDALADELLLTVADALTLFFSRRKNLTRESIITALAGPSGIINEREVTSERIRDQSDTKESLKQSQFEKESGKEIHYRNHRGENKLKTLQNDP